MCPHSTCAVREMRRREWRRAMRKPDAEQTRATGLQESKCPLLRAYILQNLPNASIPLTIDAVRSTGCCKLTMRPLQSVAWVSPQISGGGGFVIVSFASID